MTQQYMKSQKRKECAVFKGKKEISMNSIQSHQGLGKTFAICLLLLLVANVPTNAASDKERITLENGKTYEVETNKGYPLNFKSKQIEVMDVGLSARLDLTPKAQSADATKSGISVTPSAANNPLAEAQFEYYIAAKVKEKGTFAVTVISFIDESASTTFECRGPGKIFNKFFDSGKYPALWAWVDRTVSSGKSSWVPFQFFFEDKGSGQKFELTQWVLFSSTTIDQGREQVKMLRALATEMMAKEGKDKRGAGQKSTAPAEKIVMDFDQREWKVGYNSEQAGQRITEFIIPGETVETWTELVTTQAFPGAQKRMGVEDLMRRAKKATLDDCPGAMWKVIEQHEDEILYESQTTNCRSLADEYEVAKIIKGNAAIHRVAYDARKITVPEEKRIQWRELIRKARLDSASPNP